MNIEITPASESEKPVLSNLLELYSYDFSELTGEDVDDTGRYGYQYLDHYWMEPGRYPFLVRVDRRLAGFVLVRRGTYFPELEAAPAELPYMVAEFFVLRKYRRRGVGAYAAREVFNRFPGRWEVAETPENAAAQAFWRRVIGEYTGGRYEEFFLENDRWRGPVQVFMNFIRSES